MNNLEVRTCLRQCDLIAWSSGLTPKFSDPRWRSELNENGASELPHGIERSSGAAVRRHAITLLCCRPNQKPDRAPKAAHGSLGQVTLSV